MADNNDDSSSTSRQHERHREHLDLTLYARTQRSGKHKTEGGTSLPDRLEATLGVIMRMETLATDPHTKTGREALDRVETQWGQKFQRIKECVNHFFVTRKGVAEMDDFKDEFVSRFNADLAALGEEVRMQAMRRKRRGNTWPTAREAGSLPDPEFKATRMWLELAPLYMRGESGWRSGGGARGGGGGRG